MVSEPGDLGVGGAGEKEELRVSVKLSTLNPV